MRNLYLSMWLLALPAFTSAQSTQPIPCIQNANKILDEALSLMQKHYYKKESVQWDELIDAAKARLNKSGNCDDAYEAIKWCFSRLHERHSFIMAPEKAALYNGNINSGSTPVKLTGGIRHELLENDIAYLDVPWLSTADNSICTAFADSLQQIIGRYDQEGIKKWIIDLRRNTGGNCWPMLAGLAPLLGNGTYGYFVSDNEKIPFSYLSGVMMQGKHERCTVTKPYVSTAQKKIVILTSAQTASAGEIVALAFKGLPDVYVYGEPTAGLTTANATYSLSDGYLLVLTVCKEADRSGRICEGRIQPDQLIVPSSTNSKDAAKSSAVMFLQMD